MVIKVPNLRWLLALALFLAALLNYVDRNILGLLATTIQKDLEISNQQYASIINYFLTAYTVANLLSGRLVDKLGVRWSLDGMFPDQAANIVRIIEQINGNAKVI